MSCAGSRGYRQRHQWPQRPNPGLSVQNAFAVDSLLGLSGLCVHGLVRKERRTTPASPLRARTCDPYGGSWSLADIFCRLAVAVTIRQLQTGQPAALPQRPCCIVRAIINTSVDRHSFACEAPARQGSGDGDWFATIFPFVNLAAQCQLVLRDGVAFADAMIAASLHRLGGMSGATPLQQPDYQAPASSHDDSLNRAICPAEQAICISSTRLQRVTLYEYNSGRCVCATACRPAFKIWRFYFHRLHRPPGSPMCH